MVACTIPISCQISSASFESAQSTTYHCWLLGKPKLDVVLGQSPYATFLGKSSVEELIVGYKKMPKLDPNLTNMGVGKEEALM